MATLQPGEKAKMYALGKVARGGATRFGYVSNQAFISIDGVPFMPTREPGHVGILLDSVTINDELDETPNTCTFRVNGAVPAAGGEVRLTLGSKNSGSPLFAGFALGAQQLYAADRPANVQCDISCVDYTWLLGFVKVTKRYRTQSASAIAADLVTTYAAVNGFTTGGIAANLPVLDEITYTNEDLDQAMTRLARRIGGYWYVDYVKRVHLFLEETANGAPVPLTPSHPSLADFRRAADRTQVLTRVYVEGRGTSVLGPVAAGDTRIPLDAVDMFAVSADVFAKVSPQGSEGGAQHLTFTGVVPGGAGALVGPGVGPPGAPTTTPVVGSGLTAGRYQYAYTDVTPTGETLPSPLATVDVGTPIAPPTAEFNATPEMMTGGVDVGSHVWTYTFASASGETPAGPLTPAVVTKLPIPTSGGISGIDMVMGGVLPPNTYYYYVVTYVGNAGGETTRALYQGSTYTIYSNNKPRIFCGGHDYDHLPPGITQIKFYRTTAGQTTNYYYVGFLNVTPGATSAGPFEDLIPDASVGAPLPTTNTAYGQAGRVTLTGLATGAPGIVARKVYRSRLSGVVGLVATIADNTTTTYVDTTADASLGAAPPTANTAGNEYRAVQLSNIAPGPSPTTGRKVYRTIVNGAQPKLVWLIGDNTTTTPIVDSTPDASLGANAPTGDNSGLQQVPGQVTAGSTSMLVATVAPFESAGGWAVIGNGEQVIRYTGRSGNTLTGIPGSGIGAITAGVAYNSTVTAAPMLTGLATITTALVKGDEIYLVVQRDDTARQAQLAAMVKVGPGIREEWVQDRRLSITEARARAAATLALRPLEDVTITYRCRDGRTATGKTITVDLPAPTNVQGTFKIQAVVINNFRPYPTQPPTYTVTASSRRFSFEDWLRKMETET